MDHLTTEARNPRSADLDVLSPVELVALMNAEDRLAVEAVGTQADVIARAVALIAERLAGGGRLVYVGAGTSGRLGVLDATECPPTFNTPPEMVVGLIAGGPPALTRAVEGAEDHPEAGERDLRAIGLDARDVLVGIATSGRTPYVLGAARYARAVGAAVIGLTCNSGSELEPLVQLMICPVVGPEILSGSTRLKAGTATKLVLNMLTTGAMVRLGKTFGNLMVDLRATNAKLRARTNRIVRMLTGLDEASAAALLLAAGGELKTALVMQLNGEDAAAARSRLARVGGVISRALGDGGRESRSPPESGLVLGIDGGGSHTVALLADGHRRLGRGEAGPSNIQSVGAGRALAALDAAIDAAFRDAGRPRRQVGAICLGLAGADRAAERVLVKEWVQRRHVAEWAEVTSDGALLLAAGTPDGWGVGVVAGTGSIAVARAPAGRLARSGGWGSVLGDEGSGYAVAVAGLRAAVRAADGRGPATPLLNHLLDAMRIASASEFIAAIHAGGWDRARLAGLAAVVLSLAEDGDAVAVAILHDNAAALAETANAAAHNAGLAPSGWPLALAGGLLLNSACYRTGLVTAMHGRGCQPSVTTLVPEPAEGAVRLARTRTVSAVIHSDQADARSPVK
jgi:N-acetylmuramic acid 6-phosphate etherase